MKHIWKDGYVYASRANPEVVAKRIRSLIQKHGDIITPEIIVEDAKSVNSPLHNLFEWDDTEAAIKYRERQARDLLVSIRVLIDDNEENSQPIRAFVNIIDEEAGSGYIDSIRAVAIDEYREQLLMRALREINAWISRYNEFQELAELQKAINVVKHLILKIQRVKVGI